MSTLILCTPQSARQWKWLCSEQGRCHWPTSANVGEHDGFVFGPVRPGHQPAVQLRRVARRRRCYADAAGASDGKRRIQAQAHQSVEITFWASSHAGESKTTAATCCGACVAFDNIVVCLLVEMATERGSRRSHIWNRSRRYGHVDRIVRWRHEVQSDYVGRYGPQTRCYYIRVTRKICERRQDGRWSFSSKGISLLNRYSYIYVACQFH